MDDFAIGFIFFRWIIAFLRLRYGALHAIIIFGGRRGLAVAGAVLCSLFRFVTFRPVCKETLNTRTGGPPALPRRNSDMKHSRSVRG